MTVLEVEVVKAVAAPITPAFVRGVLKRAAAVPEVAARLPDGEATVAVRITDDDEMQRLNRTYAGDDHATDVLSFEGDGAHIGDIAISWPRVVEQAQAWGHSEKDEVAVLLVHGLLHLLGWDHATPSENEEMWRLTYIPLRVSTGGRRREIRRSRRPRSGRNGEQRRR
ncbi:MAG TPA: rRNA maturation RNase YbeY [Candidatus Dormibacteraeota bacterium]|nr:rRNA maturation RNase YbeY [Candidatus Dormibacteraeota bacterium]